MLTYEAQQITPWIKSEVQSTGGTFGLHGGEGI